jgi:hypothetical protein
MADPLALARASVDAAQAVVDALEEAPPEPPDPGPVPPTGGVLHGSSSEAGSGGAVAAFTALEESLVDASGQDGPVLMFDHRYNGDTIDSSIPSWWKDKGLRFGMLNGKGPLAPDSSSFANLRPLARSLPEGFTLYLFWWHEPEDNHPAARWVEAFAGFVAAVLAIPDEEYADGASIVPGFNLHGSMFREGSMFEKWGPLDAWNPYAAIPAKDWPYVLATVNGYADPGSTEVGEGEDAEWCFGPAFATLREWGATRLGIGEWGVQPAAVQADYVANTGLWLEEQGDVEVAAYFSSGVGGNAGDEGWFLATDDALAEYAGVCLDGRRE